MTRHPSGQVICQDCRRDVTEELLLQDEIERLREALANHARECVEVPMAADEERLRVAGERVGLWFGCDTPEHMADEIERLRSLLAGQALACAKAVEAWDDWVKYRHPGNGTALAEELTATALPAARQILAEFTEGRTDEHDSRG